MKGPFQPLEARRRLGKMLLLARLGEGGMASVFVAAVGDGPLVRLAAVKLLRQNVGDLEFRQRFLDEAKVVVRLHHNNLVDVRETGDVDGQLYIAMELVEGRDLATIWNRCAEVGRAFPVPLAVYIVREILRGLHYAHTFPGLGLVHRDVSPSNILVDWAGAVRLADFGLATSSMKAVMTVPGLVFGKLAYMAPEQAHRGPVDARTDVYSCGVVLWELLTGRPLRGEDDDANTVSVFDAKAPSRVSARVDRELDAIVLKALERDPKKRFDSANSFLDALSGWLARNAPRTAQESAAEFMGHLFADTRQADHKAYTELLQSLPRTGAFERVPAGPPPQRDDAGQPLRPGEAIPFGTVVGDRYRIERALGQGGMGTVYLAEHLTVGRRVAIKVLTHEWSRHAIVARRFREEARAASAAGHPNIVEVFDAGELPDGRLYIVMEHLSGHSLYVELTNCGPLEADRACRIVRDVARAIRSAHERGIIHRDLKPDNVMLVPRGGEEIVKVLDFGIAASTTRSPDDRRLTRPGHALGTPEYMAPEQAKGLQPTPVFDVYALGVMLYECLTGDPPFVSDNLVEILTRKAVEPAPSIATARRDLPASLVEFVHACVAIEPEQRPESAQAVVDRLGEILRELEHGPPRPLNVQPVAIGAAQTGTHKSAAAAAETHEHMLIGRTQDGTAQTIAAWNRQNHTKWITALGGIGVASVFVLAAWVWVTESSEPGVSTHDPNARAMASVASHRTEPVAEQPRTQRHLEPDPGEDATMVPAAAEPVGEALSEPAAAAVSPSVPRTRSKKTKDADCPAVRARATQAFSAHSWRDVLKFVARSSCWQGSHRPAYDEMRIRALFETGQFDACAEAGKRVKHTRTRQIVAACQKKRG